MELFCELTPYYSNLLTVLDALAGPARHNYRCSLFWKAKLKNDFFRKILPLTTTCFQTASQGKHNISNVKNLKITIIYPGIRETGTGKGWGRVAHSLAMTHWTSLPTPCYPFAKKKPSCEKKAFLYPLGFINEPGDPSSVCPSQIHRCCTTVSISTHEAGPLFYPERLAVLMERVPVYPSS